MKKNLFTILLAFLVVFGVNAQKGTVVIGTGTETQDMPINMYFGYSISQQIYLQSEIAEAGNITEIKFYYGAGTSNLSNSGTWQVFMGHTAKTQFDNTTDWVDFSTLTEVFNGDLDPVTEYGWVTIDISDFYYNNTDNLVIEILENESGYDASTDEFFCSATTNPRQINQENDGSAYDPSSPPEGDALQNFLPNITLEIVTPAALDASISSISSPTNGLPGTWDVKANLKNNGTTNMTACDVNYEVYDVTNSTVIESGTYNWSGDLSMGNEEEINLTSFISAWATNYRITVSSVLTGDEDNTNDEAQVLVSTPLTYSIPFYEDFATTYKPADWSESDGILADPTVLDGTVSSWYDDGFANDGTLGSARVNYYLTKQEWLFTPFIDLGSLGNNVLEFDLALTTYSGTDATSFGDDDKFVVVISTDAGVTWSSVNSLLTYDNTHTFTTDEHVSVDLSTYSGIIQLAFYAERPTGTTPDINLYIDNVRVGVPISTEKEFLTYGFTTPSATGTINATDYTVAVEVPFGTDVTALVADFTSSDFSTVAVGGTAQVSGTTANDFSSPVVYTITAEDASTQDWTVTVTVAAASTEKDFLTYGFSTPSATGTINATDYTVAVEVPYGTDVTALVADFTSSDFSTVAVGGTAQVSGTTANDFSSPVIYTITAEDLSTQDWTVTVSEATPSTDATLSDLTVDAVTVTGFDAATVTYDVELAYGTTDVPTVVGTPTDANATAETTDATALPGASTVEVTAEDGTTTLTYTINFTVAIAINDIASKGISVYPNPSNGTFTVNVENNFNLEVLDITGKVINTQVLNGTNTVTINNAGVYFLRFSNEEGSVTQKVIVQ